MVSSISQQSNSLAYEMAQVSASSSLASSSKIEKLTYNGLSESEKESLRQKYSSAVEEYNLDDVELYEDIEELDEEENSYLDLEEGDYIEDDYAATSKEDVSTSEEISFYADKYSQIQDELMAQGAPQTLNLSGYNKFNYNKINSAYAPYSTYVQSNVKVYA